MTDTIGDTRNASLAFYKQCLNWNLKIHSQPVLHVTLYFTFISYHFQSSCEEILNKGQSSNVNMELGLNMQQNKKKGSFLKLAHGKRY